MDLIEFKKEIIILSKDDAALTRKKYIKTFINTQKDYYIKNIEALNECIDGYCYNGYLWDCFVSPALTEEAYIWDKLKRLDYVFVLWDIHSCEKIFIKDYWKFDKDDVIKLSPQILSNGLNNLPEDIYIFDKTFKWSFALTHEYIDCSRFCLKVGDIDV